MHIYLSSVITAAIHVLTQVKFTCGSEKKKKQTSMDSTSKSDVNFDGLNITSSPRNIISEPKSETAIPVNEDTLTSALHYTLHDHREFSYIAKMST